MRMLLATENRWGPLIIRLGLGLVMLPHGLQKTLGLFGGGGFAGTMDYFASLGIPTLFGVLAIIAESLGALGLIVGFLTRIAALGVGAVLLTAAWVVHGSHGFFMNWMGKAGVGEGYEYHILGIAMALALVFAGGGKWSLDRTLAERR